MSGSDFMTSSGLLSNAISSLLREADVNRDNKVDLQEWQEFMEALHSILGQKRFVEMVEYWLGVIQKSDKGASVKRQNSEKPPEIKLNEVDEDPSSSRRASHQHQT